MEYLKIAVSSLMGDIEGPAIPFFSRAPYFVIVELKGTEIVGFESVVSPFKAFKVLPSKNTAEFLVSKGINVIITGELDIPAFQVFKNAGVKMYLAEMTTVKENIKLFLEGRLGELVPPL